MKEELKELPDKWYIFAKTEDRARFLFPHFNKLQGLPQNNGWSDNDTYHIKEYCLTFNGIKYDSNHKSYTQLSSFTEISFEDFKRLVLKESKFKVGDYVIPIKYPVKTVCNWSCGYLASDRIIEEINTKNQSFRLKGDTDFWFYMKDFVLKEETMVKQEEFNNNTQIKISTDTLFSYYRASQQHQKEYLTKHFQLDGSTTVGSIKGLYDIACAEWKPKIKANHPDCFKEDKVWKRVNINVGKKELWYISDSAEGDYYSINSFNDNININFTFSTEEEADNNALLYNTMMLMRSWAKFYNEVDGFKADWSNDKTSKYGLWLGANKVYTGCKLTSNELLFHISVFNKKRAEEILTEFKDDLEKLISLGMFN